MLSGHVFLTEWWHVSNLNFNLVYAKVALVLINLWCMVYILFRSTELHRLSSVTHRYITICDLYMTTKYTVLFIYCMVECVVLLQGLLLYYGMCLVCKEGGRNSLRSALLFSALTLLFRTRILSWPLLQLVFKMYWFNYHS